MPDKDQESTKRAAETTPEEGQVFIGNKKYVLLYFSHLLVQG